MKKTFRKEVKEKFAALITAAFGLVAALAWNDTVKALFNRFLGTPDSPWAQLTYAVLVTVIAVIATLLISHATAKED